MFVGHAFLAFALGILLGRIAGLRSDQLVQLGFVAAGSAILPDLDLVISITSIVGAFGDSLVASWEGYWTASNPLHRNVSHTLVGGIGTAFVVVGSIVGIRSFRTRQILGMARAVGIGLLGLFVPLVIFGPAVSTVGWVGFSFVLFGAIVLGGLLGSRTDLGSWTVLGGALLGLVLHPFTDVFLGTPPPIFYPLEPEFLTESIRFTSDSTLNLLGVTAAELTAVWAGVIAMCRVRGISIRSQIDRWAGIGVVYPLVLTQLPTPTMHAAHWLGFSLVPFAIVGLIPLVGEERTDPNWLLRSVATGLATLSLATVSYGLWLLVCTGT